MNFLDLPSNIFDLIIGLVDIREEKNLKLVCKHFKFKLEQNKCSEYFSSLSEENSFVYLLESLKNNNIILSRYLL